MSVLIPCRNAERYLAATLDSALTQSLRPLEVIVVDDGSTDRSRSIASGCPGVTVLDSPSRGASAARNHAAQVARGDFFQFLDADDLLEPHALASRVEALAASKADVAISDWQRLNERDHGWVGGTVESGRLTAGIPIDARVLRGFWAPPAAVLYRRALCERIGGWHEQLPVIQDARFLLDAARVGGKFVHVPGVGAKYRQHAQGSLSSESASRFWWDVLRNARDVERLWAQDGLLDDARRSALAETYSTCMRAGFRVEEGLFEGGRAELSRFPEHRPDRFLRLAVSLSRLTGYGTARRLLAPFVR